MLSLVSNYNQVVQTIHRYNLDLPKYSKLQSLLSHHTAWYYSPEYRELGPSKFIGFIGITGEAYLSASGSIFDGGRTEKALSRYYQPVARGYAFYPELSRKLYQLLAKFGKQPRSNFRISIPLPRYSARVIIVEPRNPPWTRDELILALDLYFRLGSLPSDETHSEIVGLSRLLNKLPIHPRARKSINFHNPNGVYMKLCNFLRLDPSYPGKGLDAGSKLDEEVWNQFANNRQELSEIANVIRYNYKRLTRPQPHTVDAKPIDEYEEFPEGKIARHLHTTKERSSKAVRQKKAFVLKETGRLQCEACEFDFADFYGETGRWFAECHHIKPIAELEKERRVTLCDLAIVCANCHRMLHRIRPWLTVAQLRDLVKARGMIKG